MKQILNVHLFGILDDGDDCEAIFEVEDCDDEDSVDRLMGLFATIIEPEVGSHLKENADNDFLYEECVDIIKKSLIENRFKAELVDPNMEFFIGL